MTVNYKKLARRFLIYLATLVIFAFIFLAAGYDTKSWNGLEEQQDDTFAKKLGNRMYFTIISFSSIGYGDITPKTGLLKAITSILAMIVIIELMSFVFDFKWRSIAIKEKPKK